MQAFSFQVEKCLYFLSGIVYFNIIYVIRLLQIVETKIFFKYYIGFIFILILIGILSSYVIMTKNNERKPKAKGREFTINEYSNLSREEYLGTYSVLVLTSMNIPIQQDVYSILIYGFILLTIGAIYIGNSLYYINPLFAIFGYSIYKCSGTDDLNPEKNIIKYFIIRRTCGENLKKEKVISYSNTHRADAREEIGLTK